MAKKLVWRGVVLSETAAGNLEGDSPAAQVRLRRERNEKWSGLVNFSERQWTGNGDSPEAVLKQINSKVLASRDFLNSDGEITKAE